MKHVKPFYFLPAKMLLLMASAAILFSSCGTMKKWAVASMDVSKQKQGGDSRDDNIFSDPFFNVFIILGIMLTNQRIEREQHTESVVINEEMYDSGYDGNSWQLLSGAGFIGKGYKSKGGGYNAHIHLNYLEVPVYLTYEHPLSSGAIYAGAGPYFAYGIGGKIKGNFGSEKSFGEDNGGYKRFDFGVGIIAGYKMNNGFQFHLGYDYGLANIAYSSQDFTAKNRTFSVNIGYDISRFFKGNKQ